MSKWQKILLGVFSAGVLLCGIGAGVMFTEFSALSYGGRQLLGETDMQTENFDVKFEPGEERHFISGWYSWDQNDVLTDAEVPLNTVRFQVTYNKSRVTPRAYWNEEAREITLLCKWNGEDDDMELLMQAKDLFLDSLKQGKLVSFDTMGMEEVTVTVNPANRKDVRLVY